ncbi:MAG: hypothetical protein JSU76_03390 [Dehalococcoidia bacterium]|nr:MAG: hypothetical protein JSU76_03390 [Dehalococcoidia bacterium]
MPCGKSLIDVVKMDGQRGIKLKIIIVWMSMLLIGSFWLTVRGSSDPVTLAVVPQVPREGEPVVTTFKLNNPSSEEILTDYRFYANGELKQEGTAILAPRSSKLYQYTYKNPLQLGEQVNFVVKTEAPSGSYEKVVSVPSYPPQIWSSFVSFASFSTSMMGFMSSAVYYQTTFGSDMGLNVGLLATIVLIGILVFMELTRTRLQRASISVFGGKAIPVLGRLRLRFGTVTWILLIIFMGVVYTKLVMILNG